MPQSPTPNMALVKPTEGSDTGVWDTLLDAIFDLIDQHSHAPGLGVKVPSSGLNINADIPMSSGGSFFALTSAKAIDFQPQATGVVSSYAGALFMNSADNELYWRTSGGSNVKLTLGTALNISGVGGFGGDYIAVGALADFTDSTDAYRFRQQLGSSVQQYARVAHADLDLFEYKAQPAAGVPANRVRHKSPAALAASYDLTWLTALPGSTQALQVDSTGQISASNTFANAVTLSGGIANNVTLTSGATASALITANAGVTLGSNQNLTFSGTGYLKHGTRSRTVLALMGMYDSDSTSAAGLGNVEVRPRTGGGSIWQVQLPLDTGERLINVSALVKDNVTGPTILAVTVRKGNANDTVSTLASGTSSAGTGAYQNIQYTGINDTAGTGDFYYCAVSVSSGSGNWGFVKVTFDYDRP